MRAQEFITEGVDAGQVLQYVKRAHAPEQFDIEYAITDHPAWELKNIPLSQLKLDPEGEAADPYGRVNWVDYNKVQDLMPNISSVLKRMPIVVDSQGWIIDGNHRATAAAEAGLKSVPAYVPVNLISENKDEYEIHNIPKLDRVLEKCCHMVVKGQQQDPEKYGQVAACLIDPNNRMIYGINLPSPNGTRRHAERVVIEKYQRDIGDIPPGSIIVTTCSPCNSHMDERDGESCKDLLNSVGIHKVYAGYQDPTQHDDADADFNVYITKNDDLWEKCQLFAQTFLNAEELVSENFADGKHPEDKGDSKRYNVPTKGSVSSLRKIAKQGGRRGQLAHWMANMKSGRAKAKHGK